LTVNAVVSPASRRVGAGRIGDRVVSCASIDDVSVAAAVRNVVTIAAVKDIAASVSADLVVIGASTVHTSGRLAVRRSTCFKATWSVSPR
jgi:hypothetical protein